MLCLRKNFCVLFEFLLSLREDDYADRCEINDIARCTDAHKYEACVCDAFSFVCTYLCMSIQMET